MLGFFSFCAHSFLLEKLMKSAYPYPYTLPRRERDPIGIIFPSLGLFVWLGAASCWAATQDVASTFGYQPSLGGPLFGHIYPPFELLAWAIKFDHPARFGVGIHQVFRELLADRPGLPGSFDGHPIQYRVTGPLKAFDV